MQKFKKFEKIIKKLRSPEGCPWDREQSHSSLKKSCIEEAAEVICAVNILEHTGDAENLKEELGDLLLQVVMHACIAEEEGYFTMDDVIDSVSEKMIRRHPHVFGNEKISDSSGVLLRWEEIKKLEKKGNDLTGKYLPDAFEESISLINSAKKRKGIT